MSEAVPRATHAAPLEQFFDRLERAPERALLLDYDGTLAPFHAERAQAMPYAGVRATLDALVEAGHTRVVVVSGRGAAEVLRLLGLAQPVEVWGSHGGERMLPDGSVRKPTLAPEAAAALAAAREWVAREGLAPHLEEKPLGAAFHWRGEPTERIEQLRAAVEAAWQPLGQASGMELHAFDGGLELRAAGWHKGLAVRQVLAELSDAAAVAYLGDDRTDEDAFVTLAGRGLSVLVRSEPRPTAAQVWLRPPEELIAFLERWQRCAQWGTKEGAPGEVRAGERGVHGQASNGEPAADHRIEPSAGGRAAR